MSAIAFRRHSLLFCSLSRKSRALTTSATDAANDLLSRYQGKTQSRSQYLEAHQIQKLSLALHRKELYPNISVASTPPKDGTPIPPGYHLVYFTPAAVEAELGADGSDRTFNPSAPFTRRMWAGGKIKWETGNKLQVGQQVEERTTLVAATAKKSRSGHEMLLVDVEKQLWNKIGLSVVDQRSVQYLWGPRDKFCQDNILLTSLVVCCV
jgi:hydroxyacyl-ACP dehydratase HTD2-like protein with hotdog domain